jgi:hypothetical protein
MALVLAAGLTGTLLVAPPPAGAAVTYETKISQTFKASANPSCVLANAPTLTRSARMSAGGGNTSLPEVSNARVIQTTGGTPVAVSQSKMASAASVATASNALTAFSVRETASAAFSMIAGRSPGDCGSNHLLGSATPSQSFLSVLPIRTSGWLDVASSISGSGPVEVAAAVGLVRPGGSDVSTYPFLQQTLGSAKRRVYLPAGWSVAIALNVEADASLHNPIDSRRAASVSASFSGRFTPAGAAVNAAHGARVARRSVTLPASVSCAGSARVKVTKYARKKARSVAILVNGRVAKRIKTIKRARYHTVRIPTAGPITISAKVTPKHGKKVKVVRSYAACR